MSNNSVNQNNPQVKQPLSERYYPTEAEAKRAFWRWIKMQGRSNFMGVVSIWKNCYGYQFSLERRTVWDSPFASQRYELVSIRRNNHWEKQS